MGEGRALVAKWIISGSPVDDKNGPPNCPSHCFYYLFLLKVDQWMINMKLYGMAVTAKTRRISNSHPLAHFSPIAL